MSGKKITDGVYKGRIAVAEPRDEFQRAVAKLDVKPPVSESVYIRMFAGGRATVPRDLESQLAKHKGMKVSFSSHESDVTLGGRTLRISDTIQVLEI